MNSWQRTVRATIAIPYLAVLLIGPFADSVIDSRTLGQDSHIEAESTVQCGVGHDEYMCQLCRLVELPACQSTRQSLMLARSVHHRVGVAADPFLWSWAERHPHHPRAPPLTVVAFV